MKKEIYICILLSFLFCSFTEGNKDWKKIENNLYSFNLPTNWVPQNNTGDGSIPSERDVKGLHVYCLEWRTPMKSSEDIQNLLGMYIQSYKTIDKSDLSVKDVEYIEILLQSNRSTLQKTEIWPKKGQRRFHITKESKEMDGSIVKYRCYFMLQKKGELVHCMNLSLRENIAQKESNQKIIKEILDSFTIK